MDLVGLRLAPALTAGIIAWLHSRDLGEALIVFAAMFAAFQLVERSGFPMSLMPAARLGVGLIAPVLAAAAMIGVTGLAGDAADPSNFYAAIAGAWVMLGLGAWMKSQMERTSWARVAVIGSPRFAKDLRDELHMTGVRAYEVIGWFGSEGPYEQDRSSLSWLGSLDHVRGAVLVHNVDLIVVAADRESGPGSGPGAGPWERVANACLDLPVRMIGANQFYEDLLGHVPLGTIDQAWYRYVLHPRFQSIEPASKRALDLALAADHRDLHRAADRHRRAVREARRPRPRHLPPGPLGGARRAVRDAQAPHDDRRAPRRTAPSGRAPATSA